MSIASDRLARYLDAETAVLQGQEVRTDGPNGPRLWRGADLADLRIEISRLQSQVALENANATNTPNIGGLGFAVARMDR